MLVVTTDTIHGWDLQRICGEVFGVHVRAGGGESPDQARVAAVARMLEHAREKGGNVVVGLRWDVVALPDWRVEVCAYGTAVVAAPVDEGAQQTATELGYGRPGGGRAPSPRHRPAPEEPAAPSTRVSRATPSRATRSMATRSPIPRRIRARADRSSTPSSPTPRSTRSSRTRRATPNSRIPSSRSSTRRAIPGRSSSRCGVVHDRPPRGSRRS